MTVLGTAVSLPGNKHWAPKSNTLVPDSVVTGEQASNDVQVLGLVTEPPGATLFAGNTGHKVAGPVPSLEADGGGKLVLTFSDNAEFRFFATGTGTTLAQYRANLGGAAGPHLSAVVMGGLSLPTAVAVDKSNLSVATVGAESNTLTQAALGATSVPGYAARLCQPGRLTRVAVDTQDLTQVYALGDGAEPGQLQSSVNTGVPPIPPVVLDNATDGWRLFTFRNTSGRLQVRVFQDGVSSGGNTTDPLPGLTAVGSAAAYPDRNGGSVAIPTNEGSLVFWHPDGTSESVTLDSGRLGGVVAGYLNPADRWPTFFLGDSQGLVHAVRGGQEITEYGWPVTVGGAITQAPALVWLSQDGTLRLVVVTETANTSTLVILALGGGRRAPVDLVWPEYQHDKENTGCLALP